MKKLVITVLLVVASVLPCISQELPVIEEGANSGQADTSAEKYQISDVDYNIDGRTREYALNNKLDINMTQVFATQAELLDYLEYIRQALENQRVLQESSLEYTFGEPGEDGIVPVNIVITTEDTWNIFPVPYPKYNSNDGFEFKLKVKDYNFFGSMEEMDLDIIFFQEDEGSSNSIGLGIDFAIPFAMGMFDVMWSTDANIDYTFGASRPEFSLGTGLDISFQTELVTIHLLASQKLTQDLDYEDAGDELYATEALELNAPFVLFDSTGILDKTILKPYVSFTYNWDTDGIKHEDLIGPALGFGASLSAGKANWIGNFRNGITLSLQQSFGYNFGKEDNRLSPCVSFEFKGYYATEYVGFTSRAYAFTYYGMDVPDTKNIGSKLRGIRDSENYNSDQIETSSAIVLNLDIPVKVVQTDWCAWGKSLFKRDMPSWFRIFDFELQIAPFLDVALIRNTVTDRTFHPKDGFYSAGLEMLVFPTRMRSIQVRLSAGFDLSTHIDDSAWRSKTSPEIEFGVGLHY